MNRKQLADRIASLSSHFLFNWHGKACGVDPLSRTEFDVWCGDDYATLHSVDEVMNISFFEGKALGDICAEIVVTED